MQPRRSGEPRPSKARTASLVPASSLAQRMGTTSSSDWQRQVREYDRDGPGLLGFYLDLVALLASLCPLIPEVRGANGQWVRSDDAVLNTLLNGYSSPLSPQHELVGLHVRHLESMGEAWLIDSEHLGWNIATVPNVTIARDAITWHDPFGRKRLTPNKRVWKSWNKDPYMPHMPTSPVRRALPDLRRLRAAVRNQIRSAESPLATNGIIAFEEEGGGLRPLSDAQTEDGRIPDADQVMIDYLDLAKESFGDDDSVAAGVPFPMFGKPPTYVGIGRDIDAGSLQVEEKAIEAFARDVNFPAQLLTNGPGSANHWNEWLLEEAQRKMGLSPKLIPVCADITEAYYRPMLALAAQRIGNYEGMDLHRVRVGFDTSFLTSKPDNTAQLIQAWINGLIDREAVLEGLGLPQDAMLELPDGQDEYEHWQLATNKPGAPYADVDEDGDIVEHDAVFGEGGGPADVFGDGAEPPEPQALPGLGEEEPAALPPADDNLGAANQAPPAPPAHIAALGDPAVEQAVIDRLYRADLTLAATLSTRAQLCVESVTDHIAREIIKAHPPRSERRAELRDLPSVEVWAAADDDVRARFPLEAAVAEAVEDCHDNEPFVAAAATAAAAVAPLGYPVNLDPERGSTMLRALILGFIVYRLTNGGGSDTFPVNDIRAAMAAAGGASVDAHGHLLRSGDGTPVPESGGPWVGNVGMTTGDGVFRPWVTGETLVAVDPDRPPAVRPGGPRVNLGWEWKHGFYGDPETPFPPHVALDGHEVASLADVPGAYWPGDHIGCRCALVATVLSSDRTPVDVPPSPFTREPEEAFA